MPLRNPGPELRQTLSSFRNCSLQPFLIVVDDGSDIPVEIDFARLGLRGVILRFDGKVGISTALNAGLLFAYTSGFEFIARMDGDDLNDADRFGQQTAYLDDHPDCLAVFGWAKLIDGRGAVIGEKTPPAETGALRRAMAAQNVLIHPTAMLRRDYVSRFGLYSERYPFAEDYDYFLRGLTAGVVRLLEVRVISYRLNQGSVSFRRYRTQLVSRLRIQLSRLPYFGAAGLLGAGRTLALLLLACTTPPGVLGALRRARLRALAGAPYDSGSIMDGVTRR